MANEEHLAQLKQGPQVWNAWRRANPGIRPDLSGVVLRGADLCKANLSEVDLSLANLRGADLSEAKLIEADLSGAGLSHAKLIGADLYWADLSIGDLSFADLRGANLRRGDLSGVSLYKADLRAANLIRADLRRAILSRAILNQAILGETNLADTNLSEATGLESCHHHDPSIIDHRTLLKSGRLPLEFLQGCGVPQELFDALPRIIAEVKYYSCFIVYGEPDREFAQKLYRELRTKGILSWLYAVDATVGERTWKEIGQKRRGAEKIVVLCSAQALVRDGVLKEIEEQIDEDPDKLVPISLDNLWKHPGFKAIRGTRDLKPFLINRNYADFANFPDEEAFERLLKGLERPRELVSQ